MIHLDLQNKVESVMQEFELFFKINPPAAPTTPPGSVLVCHGQSKTYKYYEAYITQLLPQ